MTSPRHLSTRKIYRQLDAPYDPDRPRYNCYRPAHSGSGFYILDCWIVDSNGRRHPGYNVSPVPVYVGNIGEEIK